MKLNSKEIKIFINQDRHLHRLIIENNIGFSNYFSDEKYNNIALKEYIKDDLVISFKALYKNENKDKLTAILGAVQCLWTEQSKSKILLEVMKDLEATDLLLDEILKTKSFEIIPQIFTNKVIAILNQMDELTLVKNKKEEIIRKSIDLCDKTIQQNIPYLALTYKLHEIKDLGVYKEAFKKHDVKAVMDEVENNQKKNSEMMEHWKLYISIAVISLFFVLNIMF